MLKTNLHLIPGYKMANCCRPLADDDISGYHSYEGMVIVHKAECPNLDKVEKIRIISLNWKEILKPPTETPEADYRMLDDLDFRILMHHREYGTDYSLMVASMLQVEKGKIFERHHKLRQMKLLARVEKLIIQYRKGLVEHDWIKHRNHTYYELTDKGALYLEFYLSNLSENE